MKMSKSRKQKAAEYNNKYGHIPIDYTQRLEYMIDLYNLDNKPAKMQEILDKRDAMLQSLCYYDLEVVSLYIKINKIKSELVVVISFHKQE